MSASGALLLYADDSVKAQFGDGARLLLSPCGTEFMYECRRLEEQVLEALKFRNTFSSRPFLPLSLIPSEEVMTLLPEISEVAWPSLEDGGCVTRLEDGSVNVSSLDGHAHLYMTALQKELTVKFLCQLSCTPENTTHNKENADPQMAKIYPTRSVNRSKYSSWVLPPESPLCLTKHASLYTWLLQRFSVADCPPSFQYPMDLALRFHREFPQQGDDIKRLVAEEETATGSNAREIRTVWALTRALPLTCSAAHVHRWSSCRFSLEGEDALAANPLPVKAVICNGVLYRFILDGTSVVEIHPGDGSVFISEGDSMGKYFKHCFIKEDTKQTDERLYTARDLPPDTPRAPYSVRSLISQAARSVLGILLQAQAVHQSSTYTCCWRTVSGPASRAVAPALLEQSFIPNQGLFAVYSNNVVYASYVDGVLLHMIWGFANFNTNEECPDSTALQKSSGAARHERFAFCCLRFPNGSSKLVEMEDPGEYASYIRTAVAWCRRLDEKSLGEITTRATTETEMVKGFGTVARELQKIQRFNCILSGSCLFRGECSPFWHRSPGYPSPDKGLPAGKNPDGLYSDRSVPQDWRIANVVPIFKKGLKVNLEIIGRQYSLTSIVVKYLKGF
ncbi:unnamed protein product [Ranitomeya imitator]|uniref:Uncharacterized protein n=1 Tax=Ranitomeya imitator TaxID=111125 RepID=A0ABN9MGG4_9NEOB|nr:unnamed protein product [Ranitomeya imitator]